MDIADLVWVVLFFFFNKNPKFTKKILKVLENLLPELYQLSYADNCAHHCIPIKLLCPLEFDQEYTVMKTHLAKAPQRISLVVSSYSGEC